MSSLQIAQRKIREWREDPVKQVVDEFGVEPDAWQAKILRAFPKNNRLAMKACKGPGKTTVLAWLNWNFLSTRDHPKMAATSISRDNLRDNLWAEMAKWQNQSKYLKAAFQWTQSRIFAKDHPETWFLSARTFPKTADKAQQADTLAGLHAKNLLYTLDEVGGIPDSVMATAEAGLATGGDTKIIMAGNPTLRSGPLYRACTTERDLWYLSEITGDPDDPERASRVDIQWARDQIKKYGRDNPWVLVNVFGKFPPTSINSLLGPDEVQAAMGRHLQSDMYEFSQKRLGIDVARFGDDSTVIFPRQGLAAFNPVEMRNARTPTIAARVIEAKNTWGSELEFIDGTGGYGAGVIDAMLTAGYSPFEILFNGKATNPRYYNIRAEMHFALSEWVKRGGALPDDPELAAELTAPTYSFKDSKLILEPKDSIKEKLGRSPDKSDALALTFAIVDMPAATKFGLPQPTQRLLSEFDPFDDKRQFN